MIFLEGPDNSGKTTLFQQLRKDERLVNYAFFIGQNQRDMVNSQATQQLAGSKIIYDRSRVISECIYGNLLRGGHKINASTFRDFLKAKPLVIYCRPQDEVILANRGREQMAGVLENHRELIYEYDEFMKLLARHGCKVVRYNWQRKYQYEKVVHEIIKMGDELFAAEITAKLLGAKND